MKMTLAIDIGGTKLAMALISPEGGVHAREERPTHAEEGGEAVMNRILAFAREKIAEGEIAGIGIGPVGPVDPREGKVLIAANIPGWSGTPVRDIMNRAFNVPVVVDNDVNLFTYGESRVGAARGYDNVIGIAVGTGIGGGLILNGRPYPGRMGAAGEIGHVYTGIDRAVCGCGLTGCLEAYASSRAIVEAVEAASGAGDLGIHDVAARFGAGDPDVRAIVAEAAKLLGETLAGVMTILDPEAVVIGGSVGLFGDAYMERVREALHPHILPYLREVPVLAAALGPDAALVGGGLLAWDEVNG